jgi:hypothetical protein
MFLAPCLLSLILGFRVRVRVRVRARINVTKNVKTLSFSFSVSLFHGSFGCLPSPFNRERRYRGGYAGVKGCHPVPSANANLPNPHP